MSPLGKTIVWCALGEGIILALLFVLTRSLAGATLISAGILGPVSFWLGPLILQHEKAKAQTSGVRNRPV
jgi:hypothetical protein